MRNAFGLGLVMMVAAACESGPAAAPEPPTLTVTSPMRGLLQGQAGPVTVNGTVGPNAKGDPVVKVTVNGVQAQLSGDAFTATVSVPDGMSQIETVAIDDHGTTASDTRAVLAGALTPVGSPISRAVTLALSADSFAKISSAAGPLIQSLDMPALLAPLQPMVHVSDENGEDCDFVRGFVDDFKLTSAQLSLQPLAGGLAFRAEIDGLNVPGHVRFAIACAADQFTFSVTADKIIVSGTLNVTAKGTGGFATQLTNPVVTVTNFQIHGPSSIPDVVLSLLDDLINSIAPPVVEAAMNPLMNTALGALAGPQKLAVLGQQIDLQVAPSIVSFTPGGAAVAMDMTVLLSAGASSPGFWSAGDGSPAIDASAGFQLGLADDLANEMLAEAVAAGMLDITMPAPGGAFDDVQLHATLPPVLVASATDGNLHLVIGDLLATFVTNGQPVGHAAINAIADLQVAPSPAGGIAVVLGTPSIKIDILHDIANQTHVADDTLAEAVGGGLTSEIDSITQLLAAVPLPSVAGLSVSDLTVQADSGYAMVSGQLH